MLCHPWPDSLVHRRHEKPSRKVKCVLVRAPFLKTFCNGGSKHVDTDNSSPVQIVFLEQLLHTTLEDSSSILRIQAWHQFTEHWFKLFKSKLYQFLHLVGEYAHNAVVFHVPRETHTVYHIISKYFRVIHVALFVLNTEMNL